jgi:hypothetical protein
MTVRHSLKIGILYAIYAALDDLPNCPVSQSIVALRCTFLRPLHNFYGTDLWTSCNPLKIKRLKINLFS